MANQRRPKGIAAEHPNATIGDSAQAGLDCLEDVETLLADFGCTSQQYHSDRLLSHAEFGKQAGRTAVGVVIAAHDRRDAVRFHRVVNRAPTLGQLFVDAILDGICHRLGPKGTHALDLIGHDRGAGRDMRAPDRASVRQVASDNGPIRRARQGRQQLDGAVDFLDRDIDGIDAGLLEQPQLSNAGRGKREVVDAGRQRGQAEGV